MFIYRVRRRKCKTLSLSLSRSLCAFHFRVCACVCVCVHLMMIQVLCPALRLVEVTIEKKVFSGVPLTASIYFGYVAVLVLIDNVSQHHFNSALEVGCCVDSSYDSALNEALCRVLRNKCKSRLMLYGKHFPQFRPAQAN